MRASEILGMDYAGWSWHAHVWEADVRWLLDCSFAGGFEEISRVGKVSRGLSDCFFPKRVLHEVLETENTSLSPHGSLHWDRLGTATTADQVS